MRLEDVKDGIDKYFEEIDPVDLYNLYVLNSNKEQMSENYRPGNYVMYENIMGTIEGCGSTWVTLQTTDDGIEDGQFEVSIEDLSPIPIHYSQFEMLKLKKDSEYNIWYCKEDYFPFNIVYNSHGDVSIMVNLEYKIVELKYLHQLQNLLEVFKNINNE